MQRPESGHVSHTRNQNGQTPVSNATAFFLVGPTASGKTEVAQFIAERKGWGILSADSMLVYRGMDIGTAKPKQAERAGVRYWGLDLVDPDTPFNVNLFLEHAREAFANATRENQSMLVVGGTGLYVKCLTEGLSPAPPADLALRDRADKLYQEQGLAALQQEVQNRAPAAYAALRDKANPRRLIRALEYAGRAEATGSPWKGKPAPALAGLRHPPGVLAARIQSRVDRMYASGLLEEVERLTGQYPTWSKTALQAIGYAEALAVLKGKLNLSEGKIRTAQRTRQLAKRQMTWFRYQANVQWIDVDPHWTTDVLAERVLDVWNKNGPTPIII